MGKPNCIRCLLRELGDRDKIRSVEEYQKTVPAECVADSDLYESRLAICKECSYLNNGTCTRSGFYVEARAYHKDNHCPYGSKMW